MKRRFQAGGFLVATLLLCLGLSAPAAWGLTCGNISGMVTNTTAAPVYSVTVNVYHAANHMLIASAQSDTDGTYTVFDLPDGSYKVEFDPSNVGVDYLKQWYNNKTDFSSANSVTVTAGITTQAINAILAPGGSISGTVTGTTAPLGISEVTVTIYSSATGTAVGSVQTTANGSYIYSGLPAGSYKVRFSRDAEGCSGAIWYSAKAGIATADPVTVTVGETTGIDAVLPTGTIKGTVISGIAPVFFAQVVIHDAATGNRFDSSMTSPAGTYEFNDLPPGSYKVKVSSPPPFYSPTQYATKWYDNKYTKATANVIAVAGGATITADVSLEPGGKISGTVKDSISNAPISTVSVVAYDSVTEEQIAYGTTDIAGTYTLQGLRTGQSYRIQFSNPGYVTQWYNNKSTQALADPVAVPNVTPVTGINANLVASGGVCPGTGSITGNVLDPCGNPAFAMVTAYNATTGQMVMTNYAMNGAYTLTCIPSGTYTLDFRTIDSGYMATASATVIAPGVTTLADVTLGMGGSISGRVTDASGQGVANVSVSILDSAGNHIGFGGTTDIKGYYVAGGLPNGSYRVYASHMGCSGLETAWYNNQALVAVTVPNGVTGINISFGGTPPNPQLTVHLDGTGSGSVSSAPPGIDCPSGACMTSFSPGHVILTAHTPSGSIFIGWSGGGCSGTGTCDVNLSTDTTVTATFNSTAPATRIITILPAGSGSGSVTSAPGGITCPSGACSAQFPVTSQVILTPNATAGSVFTGWTGGGCSNAGTCTVAPGSGNVTTTATFTTATVKRGTYYSLSLTDAYARAAGGDIILAKAQSFAESLNLNRGIDFRLSGGYNSDFSAVSGRTTLLAPFIVRTGKVTVANIVIR